MDSKLLKSQEQSKQLQNKELEAVAGERLDDLKHLSLPGKVARWAAVAASIVGLSVGMAMPPAQAINRSECGPGFLTFTQTPTVTRGERRGRVNYRSMCFANAGTAEVVIADVSGMSSGNNAGYIVTNKGDFRFGKNDRINFINNIGTVTIKKIVIY